jgi:apolipoprotein N-acyltransferase
MTLGRFLLFFVAGLAVAIAFPPMSWLMWPLAVLAGIVVVSLIRR